MQVKLEHLVQHGRIKQHRQHGGEDERRRGHPPINAPGTTFRKRDCCRGHDGLPAYGTFDHLTAKQVMARVDELLEAGRLRSTGGMYPKLVTVDLQLETAA